MILSNEGRREEGLSGIESGKRAVATLASGSQLLKICGIYEVGKPDAIIRLIELNVMGYHLFAIDYQHHGFAMP